MSDERKIIEVYEWKAGQPRPGTHRKASDNCIDIVEAPPDGQFPAVGDVIHLPNPKWKEAPDVTGVSIRYRVISRELMWLGPSPDDKQAPGSYGKMWIHVRPLTDEEWASEPR